LPNEPKFGVTNLFCVLVSLKPPFSLILWGGFGVDTICSVCRS